jgi:hypothetical protein
MTTRRTLKSLSVAGLVAGLILPLLTVVGVSTANADAVTITDPSGDNTRRGLDIVGAQIDNADYTLSVDLNVRADRSGTTVVGVRAHDRATLRIVNLHDLEGPDRTLLLNKNGRIACAGLTATWSDKSPELSLSVPSTCLWQGNYGAVRSWLLTEGLKSGSDVDYAASGVWVSRG